MERTFVMVKPDGVQRNLAGKIISKFEERGYKIVGLKMMQMPQELAEQHYGEHKEKPFFQPLIQYITSGPIVAMVLEGKGVVRAARKMMGATNPQEADPGTIRGTYAVEIGRNVIHGSDSVDSAKREIELYFKPEELVSYQLAGDNWIYE
ncbi:nucleoside-diphosphate kinase [Desulfitispora alkaliphila]|uniref:nucleoside-diphosphate kinase n=1 Tax=Desulfitispora alkaliphila TaxID=622674 RepID=UPI003D201F73